MAKYLFLGPDGSGKTTTAQRLHQFLDIPYVKYSQSKSIEEVIRVTDELSTDVNYHDCVIDRVKCIDHIVYGTVIEGLGFHREQLVEMRECMRRLERSTEDFYVIYMYGEVDELWSRLNQRGDETYIKKEHLTKIMDMYNVVFMYMFEGKSHHNVRQLAIDTTGRTLDQVFQEVLWGIGYEDRADSSN